MKAKWVFLCVCVCADTHHYVCLSLCITQVWVQPIHQLLYLLPIEEDDKNQEQEVKDTQT